MQHYLKIFFEIIMLVIMIGCSTSHVIQTENNKPMTLNNTERLPCLLNEIQPNEMIFLTDHEMQKTTGATKDVGNQTQIEEEGVQTGHLNKSDWLKLINSNLF